MNRYTFIRNDEEVIKRYNDICEFEDIEKGWAHHNLQHVDNVSYLVEKILTDLNYDMEFIEEAKIAALLHDTGCIDGKEAHADKSYKYAKNYFKRKKIHLNNKEWILEAIKIHSNGFDSDIIIALVLILSDKLDIKYTRIAKEGYNIPGMRQIQYIDNIIVEINNNNLNINFLCNDKININELEEFYFIKKVFKAIISFSNKTNLLPIVQINSSKWLAFETVPKSV
jgi:HD superfamily phosphohydrolase YqeK